MTGALSVAGIEAALRTARFGRSLKFLPSTTSTMDDAHQAATGGAPDGHVVVADHQQSGRGSRGRTWDSPAGNDLYFSVVLRPTIDPSTLAPLTLAAGLGVREAIATVATDASVTVKWPNDILVDDKKCAGLLVESRMSGAKIDALILGVGVNVNRERFPDELAEQATSMRLATGHAVDRSALLADALSELERATDRFFSDGTQATAERLAPHLAMTGEQVTISDLRGVFLGVAPNGAAQIQTVDGVVDVTSGRLERVA